MPLDVGLALGVARVGHLALGPDVLADHFSPSVIVEPGHDVHLGSDLAKEAHLAQELYPTLEAVGPVGLVGIEVQLSGDLHPAELPVHLGRSVG